MMYQGILLVNDNKDSIPVSIFLHSKNLSIHFMNEDIVEEILWNYQEISLKEDLISNEIILTNALDNTYSLRLNIQQKFINEINAKLNKKNTIFFCN